MSGLPPADRQPAKTNREALKRFQHWLREPLRAVAPEAGWRVFPAQLDPNRYTITTDPAPLMFERRSGGTVYLGATIAFRYATSERFPGERKVSTLAYTYTVSRDPILDDQIIRWEWHPDLLEWPHLHVAAGVQGEKSGHKLHLPTGRVAFEMVLAFLLHDLDIEVTDRLAAEAAVKESLRRFNAYRTWG